MTPSPTPSEGEAMLALALARALENADWSNTSIGNKNLITSAIVTIRAFLRAAAQSSSGVRAHKMMTPDEYAAMPIIGWHEVCRDVDGFGGTGIRFLGVSPDTPRELDDNCACGGGDLSGHDVLCLDTPREGEK